MRFLHFSLENPGQFKHWNPVKSIGGFVADTVTSGAYSANKNAKKAQEESNRLNEEARKRRLKLVDQRASPQVASQTKARQQYLDDMAKRYSQPLALEQDPEFQAQRAQLVSDATQRAAGINTKQLASGIRGGTSNMGSIQDQYDRLNVALAGLAGDQAKYRTEKADQYTGQAAELGQDLTDRDVQEINTRLALKDAIESGNVDAALQALQQYTTLRSQATTAGYGNLANIIGQTMGGYIKGSAKGGAGGGP